MAITLDGTNGISTPDVEPTGSTVPTNGVYLPAANSVGIATNSSERVRVDSSGNFLFNSGYGSVATAYGCRAWVNFNGTGTVAIRASGNVSSITDNGTGDYTVTSRLRCLMRTIQLEAALLLTSQITEAGF